MNLLELLEGYTPLTDFDEQQPIRKCLPEFVIDEKTGEMTPATVNVTADESFFAEEVRCSVCLGVINRTWTVCACLHRFCSDCLHRSLRREQKSQHECPLCRVKIPSRRASKPDPTFDALVGMLCPETQSTLTYFSPSYSDKSPSSAKGATPSAAGGSGSGGGAGTDFDLSEFKRLHEENIQKFRQRQQAIRVAGISGNGKSRGGALSLQGSSGAQSNKHNSNHNHNNHSGMVSWGLFPILEEGGGGQGGAGGSSTIIGSSTTSSSSASSSSSSSKIDLLLHSLKKPYLRSSERLSIGDIKDFLIEKLTRFGYDDLRMESSNIDICISKGEKMELEALADGITLHQICREFWDAKSELILLYRWRKAAS